MKIKNQENDYCIDSRKGSSVIAYTSTTTFTYPSLSACARAYGVARSRIVELIVTGASHIDGITTFDVPMDSEVNLDAYKIVDRTDR
jgi:hypothetical protein